MRKNYAEPFMCIQNENKKRDRHSIFRYICPTSSSRLIWCIFKQGLHLNYQTLEPDLTGALSPFCPNLATLSGEQGEPALECSLPKSFTLFAGSEDWRIQNDQLGKFIRHGINSFNIVKILWNPGRCTCDLTGIDGWKV